jgi:hypothetical protein
MSEFLLLSLPRDDVVADDRAAPGEDRTPIVWLEGLCRDRELVCFLCDAAVSFPPHCSILGDLADADKCVAIPLCTSCGELLQVMKWSRVLRMFRAMHRARIGEDLHYLPRRH